MMMAVARANPYVIQRILQTFAGTIKLDGVSESKQTLLHAAVGLNVFAYEVTKYALLYSDEPHSALTPTTHHQVAGQREGHQSERLRWRRYVSDSHVKV
jgi:hypothetical protein